MLGWPASSVLLWYFLLTATAGILNFSVNALGEEIGWRGFLVPELYGRFGFTRTALISGLIWSAWHYPLMIGRTDWVGILNFTVMVCGLSFVLCWFRLRSLSIWPAVAIHGTHNTLFEAYSLRLSLVPDERNLVWVDETGYALAAAAVIVGFVFWLMRRKAERAWSESNSQPRSS
jgi:membrane protease YdiL (CAAX protease family)